MREREKSNCGFGGAVATLVGDYILIIGVWWSSWIMENGERERERVVTSFFLFVVAQVADFVVYLSVHLLLTLS